MLSVTLPVQQLPEVRFRKSEIGESCVKNDDIVDRDVDVFGMTRQATCCLVFSPGTNEKYYTWRFLTEGSDNSRDVEGIRNVIFGLLFCKKARSSTVQICGLSVPRNS